MGRKAWIVIIGAALVLAISLGVRHGFGLFQEDLVIDRAFSITAFSLAIALQNLVWGLSQPFVGMLADRYGAVRTVVGGAILYVIGLVIMSQSGDPVIFTFGTGILIGVGLAGTSFAVVFGAITKVVAPDKRSSVLGLASAAGSFGQFAMLPVSGTLLAGMGWWMTLLVLAGLAATMVPLALALSTGNDRVGTSAAEPDLTIRQALGEALEHRGFWMLSMGYFVCGFQVVFIGIHLPNYLSDEGLPSHVAVTTLALVGLFNIFGTYYAGRLGQFLRKPAVLSGIYLARAIVIILFLLLPHHPMFVYAFGALMGLLWLSTVPLTTGTVAIMFGVRNLSMLGGIVFAWHQVGSFAGVYLGGLLYDVTGNYDVVWMLAIALGFFAAIINWPIKEQPVPRLAEAGIKAA